MEAGEFDESVEVQRRPKRSRLRAGMLPQPNRYSRFNGDERSPAAIGVQDPSQRTSTRHVGHAVRDGNGEGQLHTTTCTCVALVSVGIFGLVAGCSLVVSSIRFPTNALGQASAPMLQPTYRPNTPPAPRLSVQGTNMPPPPRLDIHESWPPPRAQLPVSFAPPSLAPAPSRRSSGVPPAVPLYLPDRPPLSPPLSPPLAPPLQPMPPPSPTPPTEALRVIPRLEARMKTAYARDSYLASAAIDSSLGTYCMSAEQPQHSPANAGQWLAVRIPINAGVTHVTIHNRARSGHHNQEWLSPFEVWLGQSAGDTAPPTGWRCGGESISVEASLGPFVVACGDAPPSFVEWVNIRLVTRPGDLSRRFLSIAEVYVHGLQPPAPPPITAPPEPPIDPPSRSHRASPCDVVAALNARFISGRPSDDLAGAGVLMRVVDDSNNPERPWENDESSPVGDRFSMTVVNQRHPDIYENLDTGYKSPGFVVRGTAEVQLRLSCSYPTDRGTTWIKCDPLGGGPGTVRPLPAFDGTECVPGCPPTRCDFDPPWTGCGYQTCQECAYPGSELADMMHEQDRMHPSGHADRWGYNEVGCL